MESIYTRLALSGSKKECARTDNVFPPISEVYDCKVSLRKDPRYKDPHTKKITRRCFFLLQSFSTWALLASQPGILRT